VTRLVTERVTESVTLRGHALAGSTFGNVEVSRP
jgi:hypothetical protein